MFAKQQFNERYDHANFYHECEQCESGIIQMRCIEHSGYWILCNLRYFCLDKNNDFFRLKHSVDPLCNRDPSGGSFLYISRWLIFIFAVFRSDLQRHMGIYHSNVLLVCLICSNSRPGIAAIHSRYGNMVGIHDKLDSFV